VGAFVYGSPSCSCSAADGEFLGALVNATASTSEEEYRDKVSKLCSEVVRRELYSLPALSSVKGRSLIKA